MTKSTTKKFTAVRLDPEIRAEVELVAKWSRRDISEILRECIHQHLPTLKAHYAVKGRKVSA